MTFLPARNTTEQASQGGEAVDGGVSGAQEAGQKLRGPLCSERKSAAEPWSPREARSYLSWNKLALQDSLSTRIHGDTRPASEGCVGTEGDSACLDAACLPTHRQRKPGRWVHTPSVPWGWKRAGWPAPRRKSGRGADLGLAPLWAHKEGAAGRSWREG